MEKKETVKRLLSGASLRVLLLGANIGVSFYLMPFLIHALGDYWYGFWTLVGTFMGYYGLFDFGLSSAVTRFISRAYGKGDLKDMNIVLNTSIVLFCFIGLAVLLVTVVISFLGPRFFDTPAEIALFRTVILILGADMALSFPMRAFSGTLISKIRYDLVVSASLTTIAIRTTLIIYFIGSGYGLIALALITLLVNLCRYTMNIIFVRREFPEMKLDRQYFDRTRIKSLFNYSKYTFITQVADRLRFKVDSFVIASFLDLSSVTIYFIAARMMEYFSDLIRSFLGLLTPVFSQYEAKGEFDTIRLIFIRATKISSALTIFAGGSIIFYWQFFIETWMGPEYSASCPLLYVLCSGSILGLMQTPSVGLLYGISKHKYYAISNTGEGILNVLVSIILIQTYGLLGVAIGTLTGMVVFKLFVQPIYISRVINLSLLSYYRIIVTQLLKLAPLLLVYFYFVQPHIKCTYPSIFLFAGLQVLAFAPVLYFFVLASDERALLVGVLKK